MNTPQDNMIEPPASTDPAKTTMRLRRRRKPNLRALATKRGQVDIMTILKEPIEVLKGRATARMDPLEAMIRRQV